MKLPFFRSSLLVWLAAVAVFSAIAQRQPASNKDPKEPAVKPDQREIFIKQWVAYYNKRGSPTISVSFESFGTISADLERKLQSAFPRHRFTLVNLKFYHHAWWNESYCLLQDRKNGGVIGFDSSLDPYDKLGPAPYSAFLSAYPAKNASDAFFKASALIEFLAQVTNARIQEVDKRPGEFSFLVCSNAYSLKDMGAMLHVPYDRRFMFGHLYFEHVGWERNRCPV